MTEQNEHSRFRLERITEHHRVSAFDCRNTYLEYYLKEKALDEANLDLSLTFVLIDETIVPDSGVIGYFTLRADSYYLSSGGNQGQRIVPVVELVCLARDIAYYGQGIGGYLLIEAFQYVAKASELIGIAGIHLAYTEEGKKLYAQYQFGQHPYGQDMLFLSIASIRKLVSEVN